MLFLICLQSGLSLLHGQSPKVDTRFIINLLDQRIITHELHKNEARNVFLLKALGLNAAGVRLALFRQGNYIKVADGTRLYGRLLGLTVRGIDHNALERAREQIYSRGPVPGDLKPSTGSADTGHHGGGSDVEGLILFQRNRHVKEEISGVQKNLQLLPFLSKLRFTVLVQFHSLFVIQVHPGITLLRGDLMVTAVEEHVRRQTLLFLRAVFHCHGSFRTRKAYGRGLILRRICHCGDHQDHGHQKDNALKPSFANMPL